MIANSFDSVIQGEPLQQWFANHQPSKEMYWASAFDGQVKFVREQVAGLLARKYEQYRNMVQVVGTHTSKSIVCPVYFLHLEQDKVRFWLRYNFYNWNITVDSEKPIAGVDFLGTFSDEDYDYCFCEGMEQWKTGRYQEDQRRFTVCISSHYDAYAFFRVLKKFFNILPED